MLYVAIMVSLHALGDGGIERTLNVTDTYIFLVGFEIGGDTVYWPVEVIPNSIGSYIYRGL